MNLESIVQHYVDTGKITREEIRFLMAINARAVIEKAALNGKLDKKVTSKLFRLHAQLSSPSERTKKNVSDGMYKRLKKDLHKRPKSVWPISGGGINSTGKKR
ncbi:hypothetical protein [Kushneria sinocarnis]|uniref:hypothetical protein n=1 Tax=Kushneria sinocarnis TaxID=595502 RepID=UPI0011C3496E|nr:hypothetical protein [Kushneria sinocarnis]